MKPQERCLKFVRYWIALLGLAQAVALASPAEKQSTAPAQPHFKYERYDAQGGALFESRTADPEDNDVVRAVFVDSKGRVWVGTSTGLAVYDGKQWSSRTFKHTEGSVAGRVIRAIFGRTVCGPYIIVEGPPGTIWLGGDFGVWRFRDGRYEEITSSYFDYIHGMAVDHQGGLWVVTRYNVQRYDGKTWTIVLCPYARPIHYEMFGLRGIAIGTNGHVWIGATMFTEPEGPWVHEGATWTVNQAEKRRDGGPPTAPLFQFDGQRWRAFGPQQGLGVMRKGNAAFPGVDEAGRIRVKASGGYYLWEGETWKPIKKPEVGRWGLRERKKGFLVGYSELLYRDGEHLVEVQPTDHQTGELLDLLSEQRVTLRLAEDRARGCVWLGTLHGLYRIWREGQAR